MSTTLKNSDSSRKSLTCVPLRLLALRKRKGWNQRQLADASGLSQRVISKAESGKALLTQSVQQIASALATASNPVFPEDLITDQLAIARAYLKAFHTRQTRMTDGISLYLTKNPTFEFSGSEKKILFAGSHRVLVNSTRRFGISFECLKSHRTFPNPHMTFMKMTTKLYAGER